MEKFDKIVSKPLSGMYIDFGVLKGNSDIVVIKTGYGGTANGYNDKYLEIANSIRDKYGYTVISISNPSTIRNFRKKQMQMLVDVIDDYIHEMNFESFSVRYIGVSNGAVSGIQYGEMLRGLRSMLCISTPLAFFLKVINENIENVKVMLSMVFPSLDKNYYKYFKKLKQCNAVISVIEGQDHSFSVPDKTQMKDVIMRWLETN